MNLAIQQLLASFDALPEADKHQAAVEILRRVSASLEGDIPEAALAEAADELFRASMLKRLAMPSADRGSVWIVDLGMAAKVRPCLVLSVPIDPQDRVLVTVVAHTTSVQGTRFEVDIKTTFLKPGVFDGQQILTVPLAKLYRKLGDLTTDQVASVEEAVRRWLEL